MRELQSPIPVIRLIVRRISLQRRQSPSMMRRSAAWHSQDSQQTVVRDEDKSLRRVPAGTSRAQIMSVESKTCVDRRHRTTAQPLRICGTSTTARIATATTPSTSSDRLMRRRLTVPAAKDERDTWSRFGSRAWYGGSASLARWSPRPAESSSSRMRNTLTARRRVRQITWHHAVEWRHSPEARADT